MIKQKLKEFPVNLIYIQIIYNFIVRYLISVIGLPGYLLYLNDIMTILTFIIALNFAKRKEIRIINGVILEIIIMLLFSFFGLLINEQPILQYFWGLRNTYRFFMFMISCCILLKKEDIKNIIKIFTFFMFPIVILATYQYFGKNLFQDLIGGIFGEFYGCCGYMNMYLCIIITYKMLEYMNKKIKLTNLIIYSILALYLSTISELKIFYFEYIIIFLLSVLYSKKNIKLLITSGVILLLTVTGINALKTVYGFEDFFSIEGILNYSAQSGYSREGNVNRLNAIEVLENKFLKTNTLKAFGVGLGNADTSQYDILNSDIYIKYGSELSYIWFSHAIMFLENGYIGLALYILFFMLIYLNANKVKKIIDGFEVELNFVKIISIMSIVMFIYNSSLRVESAYLWFWVFAIPWIVKREKKSEKRSESKYNSTSI